MEKQERLELEAELGRNTIERAKLTDALNKLLQRANEIVKQLEEK